jgi:hypothetical protein
VDVSTKTSALALPNLRPNFWHIATTTCIGIVFNGTSTITNRSVEQTDDMLNRRYKTEASRIAAISYQTIRCATTKAQPKKKKKPRNTFLQHDLKRADQFSLIDAMQYV